MNKRITTRFFEKQSGGVINPGKGTVLDKTIVKNDGPKIFDFFMVANENPTSATALPVHYEVAINTTSLNRMDIEKLTYHQCYGYYGFSGPIKVPASVMYAHKIAYYAYDNGFSGKNISTPVNAKLSNNLHFI